ncbi:GGDEF domain-containing protein [Desulfosarcina ovata]|uniref:diguanylate cyclase n=1 Tax=Desulfosarcina ovata subsp. ovata TaxID=2752305 RepID=A0A5K8A9J2_9BACT|nr:GGDEF domain-containing protein [Desulfosarcina ovata]BBO89373.1 GGDEF domain-containing protein [Desulfosarcina ovata subsp. ovata]
MFYNDSIQDSRLYLRLALEKIGKYELPTDPLNYCIWYEYSSGKNSALNKSIDDYLKSNRTFSTNISKRHFNQYILNRQEARNELIQNELKNVFSNLFKAIDTTNRMFTESGNNLDVMNQAPFHNLTEADINHLVIQIKQEIKRLESSSNLFKEDLQKANCEIDRLKKKLDRYRDEAQKDPLTKLDNRRSFENRLKLALDEANDSGNPLCMIMADIDHFKKINDTHGHLVGDNVIRMVASTIRESIKGKDLAARIGGEEFAILLPNTPFDGAMKLANDMRLAIEQLDLKKKRTGERVGTITLSFGVTAFKYSEIAEDFINRSDQALYRSKKSGRNKVTGI